MYQRSGANKGFISQTSEAPQRRKEIGCKRSKRRGGRRRFTIAQGVAYQTKKRSNSSQSHQLQAYNGYVTFSISSPTSTCTHHALPLPIINDPLEEVIPLNLDLNEHFDLDVPHISPTLERTSEISLHPTDKILEPVHTPSL